jgi:transcriptional regulator NrdR family protein
MVCINCAHNKTSVINSRPLKKGHEVWRRRQCAKCGYTFTTRENPDHSDLFKVARDGGKVSFEPYDKAKLTISLLRVFDSTGLNATDVYWLVETIEEKLMDLNKQPGDLPVKLTKSQVRNITYKTLANYHPIAGLTYGSAHGIVKPTNKRGRGRPRFTL